MKNMENNMENYYRTKDLAEASFLYASGVKLIRSETDNGRVWFLFSDKNTCNKLTGSFWGREAMVNAKAYADANRSLKDVIFNKEDRR